MGIYRGSEWNKWDLHVHTPDSHFHNYTGGEEAWERFVKDLENLPPEFKVIGINDYVFLDGYRKILAYRKAGRLKNLELILPVIELRLDKFGGTAGALSKINLHLIFSNEIDVEIIQHQFLNALQSRYTLTPQYDQIRRDGKWAAVPTKESLQRLGELIKETAPEEEKKKFGSPLEIGFNNLCLTKEHVSEALEKPIFRDLVVTAVGKTEWANIRWNDQAIADKKTIVNEADFLFVASENCGAYEKARKALAADGVNARLIDCSDAHELSSGETKDRVGNCFTWIKGDCVFEALRQCRYEFDNRVKVSDTKPLAPLLAVNEITLRFPEGAVLVSGERRDPFCWRGERALALSPYLTCLVGGRGTGKSTLLNLIHEKLLPGGSIFFQENKIEPAAAAPATHVQIDGDREKKEVEFFAQNEIEAFATNPERLTQAIFIRLAKLDLVDGLASIQREAERQAGLVKLQQENILAQQRLTKEYEQKRKELETNRGLVKSIESEEYKALNLKLTHLTRVIQGLKGGKERLETVVKELRDAISSAHVRNSSAERTVFDTQIDHLVLGVSELLRQCDANPALDLAKEQEAQFVRDANVAREDVDQFLRRRGLSAENLNDVSKATERIAALEQEIPRLESRLKDLEDKMEKFELRDDMHNLYLRGVNSLLEPINNKLKGLGAEVRPIELKFEFDKAALNLAVYELLRDQVISVDRTLRIDHVMQSFKEIDFTEKVTQEGLLSVIRDDTKTGKMLRELLSDAASFAVFELDVKGMWLDLVKFRRIDVLYDGKPLQASSFGQRCTAAIVVLLMLGNAPIVIDEPEAHLDSSLIARYLVKLVKEVKQNRQIIFATHNANFVINGDAELVLILEMSGDSKSEVKATSIENLKYRERLIALEGGREAFRQREYRYGVVQPGG